MYLDKKNIAIQKQNGYKRKGIYYNSTRITINLPTSAQVSKVRQVRKGEIEDAFYSVIQNTLFIHSVHLCFKFNLTKESTR